MNANNKLVQYVLEHKDGENTVNDLRAALRPGQAEPMEASAPERMTKFIARSGEIMMDMAREEQ